MKKLDKDTMSQKKASFLGSWFSGLQKPSGSLAAAKRSRRLVTERLETRAMLDASGALVQICLEAVDVSGVGITQVAVGQEFIVRAYVDDLRPNAQAKGVASAYLDLKFDPAIAQALPQSIQFHPYYNVQQSGDASSIDNVLGLINEVGAFYDLDKLVPPGEILPGADPVELFSVRFIATGSGFLELQAEPADEAQNVITLVGVEGDPTVPVSNVEFVNKNLAVGNVPRITIEDVSVEEGDEGSKEVNLTVTLSQPSEERITVKYRAQKGTALGGGQDYYGGQGTLVFEPGETSKTLTYYVVGDLEVEGDEVFYVDLSNARNAVIEKSRATVTILDDDFEGSAALSIDDVSVTEGAQGETKIARFTVTLSNPLEDAVTVSYATVAGTATAGENGDFLSASGTLTFAPGETTKIIEVTILGDNVSEADEQFTVVLSNPTGGVAIMRGTGTGTILDDDDLPEIRFNDVTIEEGDSGTKNAVITFKLNRASSEEVSVSYITNNGSAISGQDYQSKIGTVVFAAGETRKSISIPIVGDLVPEETEVFFVTMSDLTNATFRHGKTQSTITILDNDQEVEPGSSSLAGYVYIDANADGQRSEGEQGIGGVTLTISGQDANGNSVNKSVVTNASGYYQFTGLHAGSYVITQSQPAGYNDGQVTVGSQGGTVGANRITIQLNDDIEGINNNFGEVVPVFVFIGRANFFTPLVTTTAMSASLPLTTSEVYSASQASAAYQAPTNRAENSAAQTARTDFFTTLASEGLDTSAKKKAAGSAIDELFGSNTWS